MEGVIKQKGREGGRGGSTVIIAFHFITDVLETIMVVHQSWLTGGGREGRRRGVKRKEGGS